MALKDALRRINNKLAETFHHTPYDPSAGRTKLVKEIDKIADQHKEGRTKVPNRAWVIGYDSIRLTLRLNGHVIPLPDPETGDPKESSYVPPAEFQAFLGDLRAAVEAGELDEQIRPAMERAPGKLGSEVGNTTPRTRAPRSTKPASSASKPWTARKGWEELSVEDKRAISSRHRFGKNPDNSLIAEVGHKPDAPLDAKRKKA